MSINLNLNFYTLFFAYSVFQFHADLQGYFVHTLPNYRYNNAEYYTANQIQCWFDFLPTKDHYSSSSTSLQKGLGVTSQG